MDEKEQSLLDLIQTEFPIAAAPYGVLGDSLKLDEDAVFEVIKGFFEEGLVRKIGPFFDSARLGFKSTLVAVMVDPREIENVARQINEYREVTHNYGRSHSYNLWFTLIAPGEARVNEIIEEVRKLEGVRDIRNLPAERLYKIRVDLKLSGHRKKESSPMKKERRPVELSREERRLVEIIQEGIPVVKEPYEALAKDLGAESAWLIEKLRQWKEEGIIRRFGAAIRHRKAGFDRNAMVVWAVDDSDADAMGERFAANGHVSHCYRRPAFEGFPFTLYTMVHARTEEELLAAVKDMQQESRLEKHMLLESLKEYKKSSPVYY